MIAFGTGIGCADVYKRQAFNRAAFYTDIAIPVIQIGFPPSHLHTCLLYTSIGQILDKLDEAGENLDNWIVVFTSDHGEMLGEHGIWAKHKFYESSVRAVSYTHLSRLSICL